MAQNSFNHTTYYDNGKIKEEGNIVEDKKNGLWVFYSEDGNVLKKGNYINGKKSGVWEENIKEFSIFNIECCWKGEYRNGRKIGKWYNKEKSAYARYKNGKLNKLIIN